MILSNEQFLNNYLGLPQADRLGAEAILPLDKKMIERRLGMVAGRLDDLAKDRAAIAAQSGDSWHDGAFNENDRDKRLADRDLSKLRDKLLAQEVDYPTSDEGRVTLGSQVTLDFAGQETKVHIVGFSPVYGNADYASIETPLSQAIIGLSIGHTALLRLRQPKEIQVLSIDQDALRLMDENDTLTQ